uniref:uncharacterized protein LOC120345608 n=1 Tax=Styela clava TaxID=7725 RepID=UPI00193A6EDE|nr:uncharacterized protein LOC120345608 [Styela clava]
MLSESADCNRNEMLFVNASLTQNPLSKPKQDQSKNNFTFLNDIMVGGYGIGYEPDLEGNEQDSTKGRIFSHEQANDMECESATSSSSLLNDWLVEASQMEAHDIELLQHELELGSPMCIDDCDCKPD